MSDQPLGLALVGCGRISASHLSALARLPDDFRLVAVVDTHLDRAIAAAGTGEAQATTSLEQALAMPGIDVVLISSPNAAHAGQAAAALAVGKHVLVEKPLSETPEQARWLAAQAAKAGLVLAAGHTFRHGAAVRYLQDHRAEFGRLRAAQVTQCVFWDGPQAPWWVDRTPDEGLIVSLFAPHSLDFLLLAMEGDMPLRVHAEGARHQSGWQGEDEAMVLMAFPGRRMASLHISYNQLPVFDRKALFFDKGILEILDGETLSWNGEVLVAPPPGRISESGRMGGRDLSGYFETQLAEFARAVRGLPHRCPSGIEAAKGIELLEQVRRSLRANSRQAIDPPLET